MDGNVMIISLGRGNVTADVDALTGGGGDDELGENAPGMPLS